MNADRMTLEDWEHRVRMDILRVRLDASIEDASRVAFLNLTADDIADTAIGYLLAQRELDQLALCVEETLASARVEKEVGVR